MNKISRKGLDFIKHFEGFEPVPKPCPAGVLTWGYGHAQIPGEDVPESITEERAIELLDVDCSKAEQAVEAGVDKGILLTQPVFDMFVSYAFNLGPGFFTRSHMLKLWNMEEYEEALDHMLEAHNVNKVPNKGLFRRRLSEVENIRFELENSDQVFGYVTNPYKFDEEWKKRSGEEKPSYLPEMD